MLTFGGFDAFHTFLFFHFYKYAKLGPQAGKSAKQLAIDVLALPKYFVKCLDKVIFFKEKSSLFARNGLIKFSPVKKMTIIKPFLQDGCNHND